MKVKIIFLITALGSGGAEKFLLRLLTSLPADKFDILVISLKSQGDLFNEFSQKGIRVVKLGLSSNPLSIVLGLVLLINTIRKFRPSIIHSWMYHADLMTILLKLFFPKIKCIWCIRNLSLRKEDVKFTTRIVASICAIFSKKVPYKIICNGESVRSYHVNYGYNEKAFEVIYNGFDTKSVAPDNDKRHVFRNRYHISNDKIVLGLIGRFHPVKGHISLIHALSTTLASNKDLILIFVGGGDVDYSQQVLDEIKALGIEDSIKLIPQQSNMSEVYNSLDILISNSRSEGFSNVIGEAMATGIPTIVTDVGESAYIVGPYGLVVPYGNEEIMRYSVNWYLEKRNLLDPILKPALRNRIEQKFSLEKIIEQYMATYFEALTA